MPAMAFSAGDRRLSSPTAEAIYDAAVDLFFRQGFEATSLRQIADVVGIKVGSLYNHIRSKEELLYNIMNSVMITLTERSREAVESEVDPRRRLRRFLRASVEFHANHQRAAFIGNSELRALTPLHRRAIIEQRDTYQQELEAHVRAVAEADPRSGITNIKLATYAAVGITNHVASWYQPWGELDLEQVVDGLLNVYTPTAP